MLLKKKSTALYIVAALISSVVSALFTYLQPGIVLAPGLDSSWAYSLDYYFQHNLVLGKDIYFTFGPLGFLEHTPPFSLSMMQASSIFWFFCSIIAYFLVLILCLKSAQTRGQLLLNIVLAIVLFIYCSDSIQRLLLIAYVAVFLHWLTQNMFYVLLLAAVAVTCFLIKFSYGITVSALLLCYLAIDILRNKTYVLAASALVCLVVLYLISWLVIYGSASGALDYLKGGLEFSQGSVSAMATNPDNDWIAIIGFYSAFVAGAVIVGTHYRQGFALMPLCFLGPLFIWSKYAFGREDSGHLAFLMSYVFYLGIIWIISVKSFIRKFLCLLVVVICFFSWKDFAAKAGGKSEFLPHPALYPPGNFKSLLDMSNQVAMMRNESDRQLSPLALDPDMRSIIGDHSVDIYPWETLITRTNHLNWAPRPIYQSYLTYTPFLDQKNFDFYQGAQAPEYIIWHYHSYQDIDNRYPLSSDPLTIQAILQNYNFVECKEKFCLWQHNPHQQLLESRSPPAQANWNEWVELPADTSADIIRARINTQRTLLGKLNLAVWKEGGINIDYRLTNGDIKTHTLLIDNAASGLWASPYAMDRNSTNAPEAFDKTLLKQLLAKNPAEGYIEKAELIGNNMHVAGWGLLPFKATQTQQLNLLLYSDKQAYLIKTRNLPRPGITEHFGKTGIVDLDSCGFDETIDTHGITPGKYQLAFVVENQGETRIHLQTAIPAFDLETQRSGTTHNVAAIRLRTTRPWAFDPAITIQWSKMAFTEKAQPW